MRWLVTAGGTSVPIDRVRRISNRFTGRTGACIAREAHHRGGHVTLLTSRPDAKDGPLPCDDRWQLRAYDSFDELHAAMRDLIVAGNIDCVIHSAAVSDYTAAGIFAPSRGTMFDAKSLEWSGPDRPSLVDRSAGKVKSDEPELWLRLVKAPKLIDLIRSDWGFRGLLVKFKLEVGVGDDELLEIAERSRVHSRADLMVANTLDGVKEYAFVGPIANRYQRVTRAELPSMLITAAQERSA